jgi:hypothetical protein
MKNFKMRGHRNSRSEESIKMNLREMGEENMNLNCINTWSTVADGFGANYDGPLR